MARKYFLRRRDEIGVQLAKEGDMICSVPSFFCDRPSDYNIQTIEQSVMLSLSRQRYKQLLNMFAEINRFVCFINIAYMMALEQHEITNLNLCHEQRLSRFLTSQADVTYRVSDKIIASHLDITPESFSRTRAKLRKRGKQPASDQR